MRQASSPGGTEVIAWPCGHCRVTDSRVNCCEESRWWCCVHATGWLNLIDASMLEMGLTSCCQRLATRQASSPSVTEVPVWPCGSWRVTTIMAGRCVESPWWQYRWSAVA